MKTTRRRWLGTLAMGLTLALLGAPAQAAISCSIGSPGFFSVYDGLAATDNLNQSSYTITCTRLASDPATLNYITFTDDGLYNNGPNNRAKHTASNSYLKYDFFTTSAYATNWSKSTKCIVGTLNFGTSLSASQTTSYFSRVLAGQTGIPQGTYSDTVRVNMAYNRTSCQKGVTPDASGVFAVTISNVPACQIATPPGNIAFTYTAFTPTQATANTSFQARCSTTLPYTLSINGSQSGGVYPGVASGLNYALSLGTTTIWSPILPTSSLSGNGALQTYFINGRIAAGQAGTCAGGVCTASDPRTLTVTY